jgi:PiT family inorganic phosphate transporter
MTDIAASAPVATAPSLDAGPGRIGLFIFVGLLTAGLLYTAYSLYLDVTEAHVSAAAWWPFLLLGVALVIALGFEFVNGFHDTANAVATVIYTNSLPPHFAVVWSGTWNFLGVLFASGAVAFGILSLLPVELILQVGRGAGFAMIFALLIAAILWNLGTWYFGLPASSSHTMIGSIMGVGIANQLMAVDGVATSGVDWAQAGKVFQALLFSPLIGFTLAAVLLVVLKIVARNPALYRAPEGKRAPPWWIRGILILTCTGVSFAHGSNDGQKGMGLIMLILIGAVPTAYALNRAMADADVTTFRAVSAQAERTLAKYAEVSSPGALRKPVEEYVRTRKIAPDTVAGIAKLAGVISGEVARYGHPRLVPTELVQNVRNDMYLVSEALRVLLKSGEVKLDPADKEVVSNYKRYLDKSTKFIPLWVKVAVAIALGLGTMIGWKRIVVTVGEKIGKNHLTYAQGACAELVAMSTIAAADVFGLPVSTTHVLSSGVAGTMTANRSGLQGATVRNLLLAWVLTLPAAIMLSGGLYWLFRQVL